MRNLKIAQTVVSGQAWGYAIPKARPALESRMNTAIRALFADGTYQRIFRQYLPGLPMPSSLPR
jgi:ABC-type amino acid transport substrate-binding protein